MSSIGLCSRPQSIEIKALTLLLLLMMVVVGISGGGDGYGKIAA